MKHPKRNMKLRKQKRRRLERRKARNGDGRFRK